LIKLKNRPDIDGLRAISVLAVMLYHGHLGFPGGFIGVDVFFVISGFLITSIILQDHRNQAFSLMGFWERRVRRIVPALLAAMVLCAILGTLLLLPRELEDFGSALRAQGMLASNIHFWRAPGGYFAAPAAFQPLLHTWSLALEEQFYILYPLFIWTALKLRIRVSRAILTLLGLSLVLSIYATPGHPVASFYLLPTRAWELLVGAALASTNLEFTWARKVHRELATLVGLAAVVSSMFCFSHATRWPGYGALLPCLGTGAIIWGSMAGDTFGGRLLSMRFLTWAGLRSYSLYLLHWPLLVLLGFWSAGAPSWWMRAAVLLLSFPLAAVSYHLVEMPVRTRCLLPGRVGALAFGAAALAGMVAAGSLFHVAKGFPGRFPARALRILEDDPDRLKGRFQYADFDAAVHGAFPVLGRNANARPNLLIWGDSHGRAIAPALERLCDQYGVRALKVVRGGCPPILDSGPADFRSYNREVFRYILTQGIPRVLLVSRWASALQRPADRENFIRTIEGLLAGGVEVWVLKQVPEQPFDVPSALARSSLLGQDPRPKILTWTGYLRDQAFPEATFKKLAGRPRARILDPAGFFFAGTDVCRIEQDGHLLYADSNHISYYGALALQPLFEPLFVGPAT